MEIHISGFGTLDLQYLVLDFNGTIALDGMLLPGVVDRIITLAQSLQVHVLTADTFGTCAAAVAGLPVQVTVLNERPEDAAKHAFVKNLGARSCVCIGNGQNDSLMLAAAGLGIAVMGPECASGRAAAGAHIIAPGICPALDLLLYPLRLKATLRT